MVDAHADDDVDHERRPKGRGPRGSLIAFVVVAVIAVVAVVALVLSLTGSLPWGREPTADSTPVAGRPAFVTEQELRDFGDTHGPVYWAGPKDGVNYELTQADSGAVFVRYVPENQKVGSATEDLTVATYPQTDGYGMLEQSAEAENMGSQTTQTGALVVVNSDTPLSTYFSFPDAAFQVEVFSPNDGESQELVLAGSIELLGGQVP